ncbi:MAG: hypothetical protein ABIJ34_05300 [archaeon]
MQSKGQLTNPNPQSMVALLIFIIGLALVFYIMWLPPADRADLLEQNRTYPGDGTKDSVIVLITKEPGRLSNIAEDEITRDLPSFNLFTRTDASNLVDLSSVYIKKSLYEEQTRNLTFDISDIENTDNFILSFSASKRNGILTIILNGDIIFSNEVQTPSPSPIRFSKDLLKDVNTLVFKVSGPGIEFWKSNEFILENVKITADITDKSSQENKQTFVVTQQEKENLQFFDMRFIADCKAINSGPLEIYLNKRLIYSSVPDCGEKIQVPSVDSTRIREGENDLLFRTEKGNYLLYSIETKMKLRQPVFPTYFFSLDQEKYDKIKSGEADLNLTLAFPNSIDNKKGVVLINDYIQEIETYEANYNRLINSFIREGNNAIEIRPKVEKIDILELNVIFAE